MNSNIIKKIKSLPPLDDTVIKIQRISTDKNSSMRDLVKVVEGDPMLTANILKSANSPLYGFSKEIKSIGNAISLFGMATIRGFALSSAIKDNIKIDLTPYNIDNNSFLKISTIQNAIMLRWYSKVNRSMLDILQPASFLMEVGKIIIAHELIEQNLVDEFQNTLKEEQNLEKLSQTEKEMVGFDSEEITAKIFEKWNLESELIESIQFSNIPEQADQHIQEYAQALHVVKNSANIFGILKEDQKQNSITLIEKYGLDPSLYEQALEQLDS